MPSQKTASKTMTSTKPDKVEVEVLTAIGIDATKQDIEKWKLRANTKGLKFSGDGLTTMIHPNKPIWDKKAKEFIPPEPVIIELERETARKLSQAGKVRVVI